MYKDRDFKGFKWHEQILCVSTGKFSKKNY